MELQFILHKTDPSNRPYVLVLDLKSHTFFKIKISSPQEIIDRSIERNYKGPLKNAYMIFKNDCIEAFKAAKSEKKFRQNSECFKDYPSLWNNSPKEIKDEYDRVYQASKRKNYEQFVHYNPQNGNNDPIINNQISAAGDNGTNDSTSEVTSCDNSLTTGNISGSLFIEENDSNNCPPAPLVENTENLSGRTETLASFRENSANSPIVDNTASFRENNANSPLVDSTTETLASFRENNANNPIVDNITETLASFRENNANNPIVDHISSLGRNNSNNANNYFIVDNMGNLISSLGGNSLNNLNNYFIVDNMGNLIGPLGTNNLNNYFIVDNMGNLISPLGGNNLNNYFIVDNMGNLISSLGGINANNLNNYFMVDNMGNLITGNSLDSLM